jgi:hypothetical protein
VTDTFKKLYQGQPGIAAATIYTVPAATQAIVKQIRVVNTGAVAASLTLWHGATNVAATQILPPVTLQPGEWGEFDGLIVGSAAELFGALATVAATLTVTMYGLEIS